MQTEVSKSQFKAKALEFFRQVEASGEPVVVTDHGQPRLQIRRYTPNTPNPLEILQGSVLRYENPSAPVAEDDWDAVQ